MRDTLSQRRSEKILTRGAALQWHGRELPPFAIYFFFHAKFFCYKYLFFCILKGERERENMSIYLAVKARLGQSKVSNCGSHVGGLEPSSVSCQDPLVGSLDRRLNAQDLNQQLHVGYRLPKRWLHSQRHRARPPC